MPEENSIHLSYSLNKTISNNLTQLYMKYLLLFLMTLSVNVYGQNEIREYLFTTSDENFFVLQEVVNNGNYYELIIGEPEIDNLSKNQPIVEYEKAFPKLKSNLNKVYRVKVEEHSSLTLQDLLNNPL